MHRAVSSQSRLLDQKLLNASFLTLVEVCTPPHNLIHPGEPFITVIDGGINKAGGAGDVLQGLLLVIHGDRVSGTGRDFLKSQQRRRNQVKYRSHAHTKSIKDRARGWEGR